MATTFGFKRTTGTIMLANETDGKVTLVPAPIRATFTYRGEAFAIHPKLSDDGSPWVPRCYKVSHIETGYSTNAYAFDTIAEAYKAACSRMEGVPEERFKSAIIAARAKRATVREG